MYQLSQVDLWSNNLAEGGMVHNDVFDFCRYVYNC